MSISLFPHLAGDVFPPAVSDDCSTHSSLRKSKVLDFSVGNWEKVLLLFTRPPGVLYLKLDWDSGFLMAGELEEELNSLLKLQMVMSRRATKGLEGYEGEKKKSAGNRARQGVTDKPHSQGGQNHNSKSE